MARTSDPHRGKPLSEYQVAMTSIKETLKRQKLTYRELAKQLKLSESGIKKILGAKDGSFQRVVEICGVLGVSLGEVLAGQSETVRDVSFTETQQDFFVKNPRAFALYWFMVYERRGMEEASRLAGVNEKERFSILRRLDQLLLIELLPGDRVRVPTVKQVRWVGGGPMIAKIYREWSQHFIREIAKPEEEMEDKENRLFLIRYFKATPRTFQDLLSALRDLEAEFVRRATQEMRTEAPDLMHVRWISAADNRSFMTNAK